MKFRNLKAEEIDVKIGNVTKKGYTLLLYKNARVDMAILDEAVGAENWQRDHKEVKGNLYCGIGINIFYDNKNKFAQNADGTLTMLERWVWKWDCGTESAFGDKEKGEASDSFKRAGFNWGIGRELYTSPFIFIFAKTKYNESKRCYEIEEDSEKNRRFRVTEIAYNENNEIIGLVIMDNSGCIAYSDIYSEPTPKQTPQEKKEAQHSGLICESCKCDITDKVADYSKKKYGKMLCYDCQRKQPKPEVEV